MFFVMMHFDEPYRSSTYAWRSSHASLCLFPLFVSIIIECLALFFHTMTQCTDAISESAARMGNTGIVSQRSHRGNRLEYGSLSGNAPALRDSTEDWSVAHKDLENNLENGKKVEEEASLVFAEAEEALDAFQEANLTTFEEFKAHGVDSAEPIITDFKGLFLSPKGDYVTSVSYFMAAHVLDPLCVISMDTEQMIDAIKSLHHFGFDEFRRGRGILNYMIKELHKYQAMVASTTESFWSKVEGAAKYDAKLAKQAEAKPEKYAGKMLRDDRIEKARRVWEWWRAKAPVFNFFFTAAHLVALVPISSAMIERIFSPGEVHCRNCRWKCS